MRRGAILLLMALSACGRDPATDNVASDILSIDRIEMTETGGRYIAERAGKRTQIDFAVPMARIAPEVTHIATPVQTTGDGIVVMQDDYSSRPADGRCADGVESFIRVFSLPEQRELIAIPAVSCRENIGADVTHVPSVTWVGDGHFRIEGNPARTFSIRDGRVTELKGV